ncbi:MAG: heavy metal translocating P-type ATPase, partial [Moraxellaceae bacterium]|nr:heavy metal translocating P-type ATPase [Moraxellaceae bacterium]
QRTKRNSLNSIEMMLSLVPILVEKQSEIGEFYDIDLIDVKIGDVLRAKQGTRIATDGVVIEGEGWCDESHLTGESQLLAKEIGDKILAGALVENGSLVYRVTATGEESQLGDMINALNEAQNTKAPIAQLADMVASFFVPFVLLASVVTFITTMNNTHSIETSILYSVAVLVVACPCALGLATPSAIMAGMGLGVRHGILFKNAEALERAGNINTVVFDKTGTLTEGKPTLVAHLLMDKSLLYSEVLQLAASVEAHASHPLATTLVESAQNDNIPLLPVSDVKVITGQGIQGNVADIGIVKVGSSSWLNVELPKHIAKKIPKVLQHSSLVAVSIDDIPLGLFAFADKLRPDALATINQLKEFNVNIILMSGDRLGVVEHINEELQIGEAYADMTPRDKAEQIKELQAKGKKVAMVGDGVNDSPAMATADASFALIDGTDIAKNTASACIMGDSLLQVLEAIHISKLTVKHIRQNLFFAFIYNFLAIPLASYGFLNPMFAAGLMAISSLSVLINALRLNRYQF